MTDAADRIIKAMRDRLTAADERTRATSWEHANAEEGSEVRVQLWWEHQKAIMAWSILRTLVSEAEQIREANTVRVEQSTPRTR